MPAVEFTPEQITALTAAAIEDLRPEIVRKAKEQVSYEIVNQIQIVVRDEVKQVIDENFKKQLHEELADAKPKILEAMTSAAAELTKLLAAALVQQAATTLADNYKRKAVLQELIGKY